MLSKQSLKMKLSVGFGVLLGIISIMSVFGYYSVDRLSNLGDEVNKQMTKTELAYTADDGDEMQINGTRTFLLTGDEEFLKHREEGRTQAKAAMGELGKLLQTERGKALYSKIAEDASEVEKAEDRAVQLRRAGKTKAAMEVLFDPRARQLRAELDGLLEELEGIVKKLKQEAEDAQNEAEGQTQKLLIGLALVGVVVGLLVAFFIIRSITGATARMLALIQAVAANDLAVDDLHVTSQDEIGKAGIALNQMKNNLREIVQSIAGTAEHVAAASEEISSSATQQAQGAETQKDQTTQVATVLQVSDNSNKASEAARKASETARHGGSIVDETLAKMRVIAESVGSTARKMEELGKSSDQIGRIIGVIDDIADQTNLLALNAAIEAARAGEQGRGFAVVADEVRKLAERTTTATKEIAQMIKNIQDETRTAVSAMEQGTTQVEEGVASTAQAGDSLKEIIQMAEQVGEMITHIATAATEQSSASEEVNNNMDQIAKLVKESAAGAQQSAKACQDLSGLALDLQKMVANFKLGDESGYRRSSGSHYGKGDRMSGMETEEPRKALAAAAH